VVPVRKNNEVVAAKIIVYAGNKHRIDWPDGLIEIFLGLEPRPTMAELKRVLDAPGLVLKLDSQRRYRWRGLFQIRISQDGADTTKNGGKYCLSKTLDCN